MNSVHDQTICFDYVFLLDIEMHLFLSALDKRISSTSNWQKGPSLEATSERSRLMAVVLCLVFL